MKWVFIRAFEVWAVAALLKSPTFHRGVEKVAKTVHRVRHGTPLDEMGGTNIDLPNKVDPSKFLTHFKKELREQLGFKDPPKPK